MERLTEVIPSELRGSGIVSITGSRAVAIAALRDVMTEPILDRRWLLILGAPDLGLEALQQHGIDLSRVVVIPSFDVAADTILAAALDGIDVVLCGPDVQLGAAQQRRIAARVRRHRRFLLTLLPWTGADLSLRVVGRQWHGTDHGAGWLRTCETVIERSGRGAYARPVTTALNLTARAAG